MKQHYMHRVLLCCLSIIAVPLLVTAQTNEHAATSMLRIYEDNDFINIAGNSTDQAYTNGTKIDYFYAKPQRPRLFIDRLLPTAGAYSNNLLSWGLTELMFTPNDLGDTLYQPNDYPYSTAIFVTHGLNSYNASKKISFHTELMAGIRGPAALGKPTQTFIHRVLKFQTPRGWHNQLKNKIIFNARFAAEKQLYNDQNTFEIIGGAAIDAGNFSNAVTFYPIIRVGKMNPYFNGLINQYTSSGKRQHGKKKIVQAYLLFKPGVTFSATNGMLQAGNQQFYVEGKNEKLSTIKHTVWFFNGGAVLSINRIGISFNQNFTSALMEHLYAHAIGNVSLYYGL